MRQGTPAIRGLRLGTVLAAVILSSGWSVPLALGSEAPAPTPPVSAGDPSKGSTTYDLTASEFSLTVSPTRLVVGPAELTRTSKILVVNRGQAAVPVTVQERNFIGGSDGSLTFQDDAPYAAGDWITVSPASFEVAPGASQIVSATITVPPDPEPGDHQVAIVFLVEAGRSDANVKINRGIAAPLYITVPGPTDDRASLGDLIAPGFVLSGPVDIATSVRDTGTVHRDFRGRTPLVVSSGGTTTAFPDFTVLRGATRDVNASWDPPLMCICQPTVTFANADGSIQTATTQVIVFPLHLLGIAVGTLLLLALLNRWRGRRYHAAVARAASRMGPPTDRVDD